MAKYNIVNGAGDTIEAGVTLARAAEALQMDAQEVEWAIEEWGGCDGEGISVVEAEDPGTGIGGVQGGWA